MCIATDQLDDPVTEALRRARAVIEAWQADPLGRGSLFELLLYTAIANEPILIVGAPGSGKSAALRDFMRSFHTPIERLWEYHVTRESTPASLADAEHQDRSAVGGAWDWTIVHLEEVFQARSAMLNFLIHALDRRHATVTTVESGIALPQDALLVGSCHEVPESADLAALRDRFAVKIEIAAVPDDLFETAISMSLRGELMYMPSNVSHSCDASLLQTGLMGASVPISRDVLVTLQRAFSNRLGDDARRVKTGATAPGLPPDVAATFRQVVRLLTREDRLFISNRKIFKLYKLMRARAWIGDAPDIRSEDLALVAYMGDTREEIALLRDKVPVLLARLA